MPKKTHAPDYALIVTVGVLVFFGLTMLASASSVLSFERHGDSFYFLKRQLLVGVLPGLIALIVLSRVKYQFWRKYSLWFLGVSLFLLVLVFIPGIGLRLGGSSSWISLFGMSAQPIELVKIMFLIYLATWLERRHEVIKDAKVTLAPFIITLGMVAGLIVLQPDVGTLTVILITTIATYFAAGAPLKHLVTLGAAGIAGFYALIKVAPYRLSRLTVYLNPELDPQGIGYHINQALLAVGSGGILGLGLGHSRQKFAYLPEAAGDSIFAIIGEELGFIFSILLIILFTYFVWRVFKTARHAPDAFGRLLATGIGTWLGFQAFLNIGAMVGIFPLTGLPLPFISQGGTAMLAALAAVGLLISISRQTGHKVAVVNKSTFRKYRFKK